VLREQNIEYKVWERYAENASGWVRRSSAKWTAARMRRYEAEVASRFDRCVVVSPADAAYLRAASPRARIEVVPFGVDTEYFYPRPEVPEEPFSITLTGHFGWGPKQQSLHALLTKVIPILGAQLPEAKVYIVGSDVPRDLQKLAEGLRGVVVTGPVADVRPYIARSSLLINYMESGGGIAIKVLEAMAMRKPVLCNSLGCEGIPVKPGEDVFVADGPEEFATAAARLLRDESTRTRVAESGYRKILEEYSWQVIAGRLGEVYGALAARREMSRSADQARVMRLEGEHGRAAD
jgi:glycosyltransferase involved in cell wall biosynthesis